MNKIFAFFTLIIMVYGCNKIEVDNPNSGIPEIISTKGKIDFVKTLGGSKNDGAKSIVKTIDGGYAVAGYTQSNDGDVSDKSNTSFDFWVKKFNENSVLQWSKTYGGTADDRANDIIQTSDGGYAVLGYTDSTDLEVSNAGFRDFWMLKLAPNGTILWQKTFGFSGLDYGSSILQTSDNGYLLTGVLDVTASGGLGNAKPSKRHAGGNLWAIKLTPNGTLEWSKYFGGSFTDVAYAAEKSDDNSFLIVGSSDSNDIDITNNKGSYDFWALKLSANGSLVWQKSYGGSEIDEARAITATQDGNFLLVGDTRSKDQDVTNNSGAADVWLLKINTLGNIIWQKTIGGTSFDVGRSISKTQDNGFIIAGSSRSSDGSFTNKGSNDALLTKVDNVGNLVWQKTIGGTDFDFFYDAIQINNGAIFAVGESASSTNDIAENKGFTDALIVKVK